jgi:hypothetical protein
MNLKSKIIVGIVFVISSLVLIPLLITNILTKDSGPIRPDLNDPQVSTPQELNSTSTILDEGFRFDLVEGWNLVAQEAERAVDRYRYERDGNEPPVFTMSFYNEYDTIDDVIEARYGTGFIDQVEDLTINEFPAKRLTSAFLDNGNSIDIIVNTGKFSFVSLYGVRIPDTEQAFQIVNEIDHMQMSFSK